MVYAPFGFLFLIAIIFFAQNWISYKNKLTEFEKREINGKIILLRDKQKGIFEIKLSSNQEVPNLRIGWELEKYNILIGDSVSKKSNSKIMSFYKEKNGVFKKYWDYEIDM